MAFELVFNIENNFQKINDFKSYQNRLSLIRNQKREQLTVQQKRWLCEKKNKKSYDINQYIMDRALERNKNLVTTV